MPEPMPGPVMIVEAPIKKIHWRVRDPTVGYVAYIQVTTYLTALETGTGATLQCEYCSSLDCRHVMAVINYMDTHKL